MRKNMIKSLLNVFICMALLLTAVGNPLTVNAAEGGDDSNKIFAGWYKDEALTDPWISGKDDETDKNYEKYVDKDILTVAFQVTDGTKMSDGSTDLRLVTTVDTLHYKEVGFKVAAENKETMLTLKSDEAYTSISALNNGGTIKYAPKDLSGNTASNYFIANKILGVKSSAFFDTFTVTPYWITLDGTTVDGAARTFTIGSALPVSITGISGTTDPSITIAEDYAQPFVDASHANQYIWWWKNDGGIYLDGVKMDVPIYTNDDSVYTIAFGAGNGCPTLKQGMQMTIKGTLYLHEATGKSGMVTFEETTFVYTGDGWAKVDEVVNITGTVSRDDGLLVFTTDENDIYNYIGNSIWWVKSEVYLNSDTTPISLDDGRLVKSGENQWYIGSLPTEAGTTVRIEYCLVTNAWESPKILFTPTTFVYTGTEWVKIDEVVTITGVDPRTDMLMFTTEESNIYTYTGGTIWWVKSGVYLNDSTTPINFENGECTLVKNTNNQWYIGGLPTEEGTTVTIKYCVATYQWSTPKILFAPTTFVFTNGAWTIAE